jgi:hypothetical protein
MFFRQIQKARSDASTYDVLQKLYELFVLDKIERNLLMYREHDYMTWEQADMVKERVRDLTYELGDSALNIIEATSVPDRLHGSCIAQSDG